jgi:predicted SnoaL-like aldol condensation-catalyzing enzyme
MDETPGISEDYLPMDAKRLLQWLQTILNGGDLENLTQYFQLDYESTQPGKPDANRTGRQQLLEKWGQIFREHPNFRANLLRYAIEGDTVWTEWHWFDEEQKEALNKTGVVIYGVEDGLFAWSREYMVDITPDEEVR